MKGLAATIRPVTIAFCTSCSKPGAGHGVEAVPANSHICSNARPREGVGEVTDLFGNQSIAKNRKPPAGLFRQCQPHFMPRPFYDREEPIPKSKHTGLWQNPECVPKLENV
jgi:hypothetical protein